MARRKILLAAMGLDIGGAETHVAALTRELQNRGNDVTVVSAGGAYERDVTDCGATHVYAPLNTRSPLAMLRAFFILRRVIKREKPEIVHAHARIPAFLCGLVWRLVPKRRRFRFVTTAHWVFAVTRATRLLSDWGQKQLAVSGDVKDYLTDNYGIPPDDITVTVNGVDTSRFSPDTSGERVRRELGIPDSAPVALSISRLDLSGSGAGITAVRLVEAAPALIKNVPDIRIIITGGGVLDGDELEQKLRAEADEINRNAGYNAVIVTGARTDTDELAAACDVFAGVSRSAMEAASAGKPVILAGGEGFLGLFTPDNSGDAVATNFTCRGFGETTAERLADEIIRCLQNSENSGNSGKFAREFIVKHYSAARMADDAEACYDSAFLRRNVVMSGYYGFDNAGDEAILQSVRRAVEDIGYCDVTVLSRKPRFTAATHGCRAVGRFNPFALAITLSRATALVFGGGSLLQDETSTRSLLYYLTVLRLARLFRVKTMIYANGIGPVTRAANRKRVANAVLRADAVTLRDAQSRGELIAMGVPPEKLTVTSDPVLLMEAPDGAESREIVRALGITPPYAVFSVRRHAPSPGIADELAKLADMLSGELKLGVVFVPMQFPTDVNMSEEVVKRMKTAPVCGVKPYTAREILAILRCADAVITMRLHTLIFAARAGSPTAAIDLNPKINAFLLELNMPNLGAPEDFRAETAFSVVRDLAEQRDERSAEMLWSADVLAERARTDAEVLRGLLG